MVNSSSDAIFAKGLDSKIIFWNKSAERIFGFTADEIVGQPVTVLLPPDRYEEDPKIMARVLQGEAIEHYETVRCRKDGRLIDVSLTVSPIRDAEGIIIGASQIARDTTRQKRDQEQYRVTLSTIGDAVITVDSASRIRLMNQRAEALIGRSEKETLGQDVSGILHLLDPITRKELPAVGPVAQDLAEGQVWTTALLISKGREEIPIEKSVYPITALNAETAGCVIVIHDLREKQSAAVASSRLASIIEGSDDAVISKNLNGIVTSWNPGAERVFGYTEKEMIGQPILKLLPPERLMEEQDILSRLQKGERVDHFQTVRVRKDGTRIHVSLTISPIRNAQGVVIGASKIARDITLLREAQEKLESYTTDLEARVRERTKKLEEMVSELESFSYSLSHDMRAPLRAIQSFTEMVLSERGESLGEYKAHLEKVIAAATRMDRLILDVLSFSKISRSEIIVRPIDIEHLIDELIAERHDLVAQAGMIHVEGPFPKVIGHEASLTQCMMNLIANAVKFVRRGEVPHVQIFAEEDGNRVRICVKDNGIGIAPDIQKKLFSLFNRGGLSAEYAGTGIGLAIVKKAAERMNGSVGVRSLPGHGSTFWIELPKAE